MYIDNNKMIGGGQIETANSKIVIMEPEILKSRSFDYCLIAVENYQEIRKQCLQELLIPESKILIVKNLTEWNKDLLESIFDVNILGNPERYKIEGVELDLGEGHALPLYQKHYKMYDRFMPYLSEITNKKEENVIIDIDANVGDSLAAMCRHTGDRFLCIEPVNAFLCLLEENVRRLGMLDRVDLEQVFITDKVGESYKAVISTSGTAVKERIDYDDKIVPSKSVDYLIREKALEFKDIDLLKIDTDGYDADCIISARERLNKGSALIYWENYISSYEQYEKYLETYKLLHSEGYVVFLIIMEIICVKVILILYVQLHLICKG